MKVLITGATGMVGSYALQELLDNDSVTHVVSVGRKKTHQKSDKLEEIIHDNFLDFGTLEKNLTEIDLCIYCLGVYQNQVSKKDFFAITCDYQEALTSLLEQTSPDLAFVLFSAQGADTTEKSRTRFANGKGRAENLLNKTVFPKKYIFRPGYIHPTGERKPYGRIYLLLLPLLTFLFKCFPAIGVTDKDLAKAMVDIGVNGDKQGGVFENNAIRQMI